jgi:anti-sigma regulatory factor (Ser/Thr protein kinase)
VVTLSEPVLASAVRDMRWIRVDDTSAIGACRNAAAAMAAGLGFPAAHADQLAVAVTEAASNLHKHARDGVMLVRVGLAAPVAGIEMIALDAGPGLRDVSAAMRDGHSTAGTLGIGLGAIRRMADTCDVYSATSRSTVVVARFWPQPQPVQATCAGLTRPITGETACGDAFAAVQAGNALTGVLCDGLGHGPRAAEAADEAVRAVLEAPDREPGALVRLVHERLSGTRGGAVAVVQVTGSAVRFAGLGNVAAWIIAKGGRSGLVSVPGIAGHQARSIRTFDYQLPAGAAIVLHSDGLTSRWDIQALPGLESRDPLVIAAVLLAEAGVHRDDAGILVLKP